MKYSLRAQIEQMLRSLIDRQNMLDKNVREYAEAGNYSDAAINQIKRNTLTLVIKGLEEALTKSK